MNNDKYTSMCVLLFVVYLQVTEAGRESLPSWMYYDASRATLYGIPSQDELGSTFYIEVHGLGRFTNDTLSHAKDVFVINVVEDNTHPGTSATPLKDTLGDGMKPIKCAEGSAVTMVTIIVDIDLSGTPADKKVGVLRGFCSHLAIPPELPRLIPVGNRPMFDSSALVAGPGDVKRPQYPGAVVQWEVGCGNVNANHMPVLQRVEATAHNGSMSSAVGHGIIGWHVTNNKIHVPKRMRRHAAIQPTATLMPTLGPPTHQPVPTIVIEESEHPPTRVVPSMASPTFPGEIQPTRSKPHRHHRTKTRGRHHQHKTKQPKHSPTKKHHHLKTHYPKTPRPTATVMPIVPTRLIDVTPTLLDSSMERPQPTLGVLSPSMTSTAVILEPSITAGIPPVRTSVATEVLPTRTYIVPEVSTGPIQTTATDIALPTKELPKASSSRELETTKPVKPTKTTEEPFNYAPILKNDIDRIVVPVGDVLSYKVPKDTFYDFEDGNTENLKLVFLTVDGLTLPRNSWVKFNQSSQTLYGLPLPSHVGRQEYLMAAIDRKGKIARDAFEIVVQRRPNEQRINHEFSITLDLDYHKFLMDVDKRIDVANKLAAMYGDPNADKITVTRIAEGSVVYAWTNNSVASQQCPTRELSELVRYLITANHSLNQTFIAAMHPYRVEKAGVVPMGSCIATVPPVQTNHPAPHEPRQVEPAPRETSDEDVLITTVVPAVVIAAMLLLAGLIACVLYRKKRKGKLSDEDQHTFVNKGIPIIFADELEDKPDPPTKPLILDDEKPPLPPPEYRRSSFGSAPSTPNSDHKEPIETTEDERDDNDMTSPLYQPPPPFTGMREHRQPRPRIQHTYRNPPPYVPP